MKRLRIGFITFDIFEDGSANITTTRPLPTSESIQTSLSSKEVQELREFIEHDHQ